MSDEHCCPRCNAPFLCLIGFNTRHFKCGSSTQINSVACGYASQLQDRITQLEAENDNQYPEWIKCNELNAIQSQEIIALKERIKRLEEAGDALANNHNPFTFIDWLRAKEDQP